MKTLLSIGSLALTLSTGFSLGACHENPPAPGQPKATEIETAQAAECCLPEDEDLVLECCTPGDDEAILEVEFEESEPSVQLIGSATAEGDDDEMIEQLAAMGYIAQEEVAEIIETVEEIPVVTQEAVQGQVTESMETIEEQPASSATSPEIDSNVDRSELMEKLEALGYVKKPSADTLEVIEEEAVLMETEKVVEEQAEAVHEEHMPGEVDELAMAAEPMEEVAVPMELIEEVLPAGFDHNHTLWTQILKQHVKGTNFNYGALKQDQSKFNEYLAQLHAVTPSELKSWTKLQRFAFWINVYNAHTIKIVVDNYPLKGIRSLDTGFGLNSVFDKEFIDMKPLHPKGDDDKLSLNDVENTILREGFKDARVHSAVNCASISCPPLRNEAFVAARLEEQLNSQMKAFINDASRNEFDPKRGKVKASSIFKWFKADFVRDAGDVKKFMSRYASADKQALLQSAKFSYLDYNWKLNDAK